MKKMNKLMIALALGAVLLVSGAMVAQASSSEVICEVRWGLGILQRIFPAFDAWIHATTCIIL